MTSPHGPLRVGVGGPVGSGKTALMDALCKRLRDRYDIAAITNDIYTKEDAEFLTRSGALAPLVAAIAAEASDASLDSLGGAAFRADIASMKHETQYSRLFRS